MTTPAKWPVLAQTDNVEVCPYMGKRYKGQPWESWRIRFFRPQHPTAFIFLTHAEMTDLRQLLAGPGLDDDPTPP